MQTRNWSTTAMEAVKRLLPKPRRITVKYPAPYSPELDAWDEFSKTVDRLRPRKVIEVGTLQSRPGISTHCHWRFPWVPKADFVRLDVQGGADVDVVGDLHALPADWNGRFDCFIANAVFEHLERPWIAAKEVARILKPGGIFLVGTHQCYPIHSFPSDYFRFSRDALRLIFEDAGLVVDVADYRERCVVVPPPHLVPRKMVDAWNGQDPAFVLVGAYGHKPA
jgi:SAM-dependent methyltransferase